MEQYARVCGGFVGICLVGPQGSAQEASVTILRPWASWKVIESPPTHVQFTPSLWPPEVLHLRSLEVRTLFPHLPQPLGRGEYTL